MHDVEHLGHRVCHVLERASEDTDIGALLVDLHSCAVHFVFKRRFVQIL